MKTAKEIVDEKFYIARCVTDGMVNYEEAAISAVNEARKEAIEEAAERAEAEDNSDCAPTVNKESILSLIGELK